LIVPSSAWPTSVLKSSTSDDVAALCFFSGRFAILTASFSPMHTRHALHGRFHEFHDSPGYNMVSTTDVSNPSNMARLRFVVVAALLLGAAASRKCHRPPCRASHEVREEEDDYLAFASGAVMLAVMHETDPHASAIGFGTGINNYTIAADDTIDENKFPGLILGHPVPFPLVVHDFAVHVEIANIYLLPEEGADSVSLRAGVWVADRDSSLFRPTSLFADFLIPLPAVTTPPLHLSAYKAHAVTFKRQQRLLVIFNASRSDQTTRNVLTISMGGTAGLSHRSPT
jgi:hypothetical protein